MLIKQKRFQGKNTAYVALLFIKKSVCFRSGKQENTENNDSTQTIITVLCVELVLIVLVAVYFVLKKIRRKSQNKNKQEGNNN